MKLRIEICGGIASGKTTLARLFNSLGCQTVLEDYNSNPFWSHFYRAPEQFAFETEISFLIQHYSLIKETGASNGISIFDFSPVQDMAYADINLSTQRRRAFEGLYRQVMREVGEPDVLVHLVCSPEEELERIRRRARAVEANIQLEYLDSLNRAISARVARVSPKVRVVTIDSEEKDFANDPLIQAAMRQLILAESTATRSLPQS